MNTNGEDETLNGEDLLDEKNLWQIYKKCIKNLSRSRFNMLFVCLSVACLIGDTIFAPDSFNSRLILIRSLADSGLGFGSTILGFLIAGFTIFATLTKPNLFVHMYSTIDPSSGLNYLKRNFFAFVETFVVYLSFLLICLIVKLVSIEGGVVANLVNYSVSNGIFGYVISKKWIINFTYFLFGGISIYTILSLKSFVYNTYHTVITSIVWMLNLPDEK